MPSSHDNFRIDPQLDSLLDEALAPQPAPVELNDKILAATQHRLPSAPPLLTGVVARLGGVRRARATAAAVLLCVEAGIWATIFGIATDASALVNVGENLTHLDRLARSAGAPLDADLFMLEARIELATTQPDWGQVSLDQAIENLEREIADETPLLF